MKHFDITKSKYNHLFHATMILTNFLHKFQMEFTYEIIDNQNQKPSLLLLGWKFLATSLKPLYPSLQIMHLLKSPYS
jgi:hypothetical protein